MPEFPETAHGTRARYVRGCRCKPCTKANREYARSRSLEKAWGRGNPLITTGELKERLWLLNSRGIGLRTVSEITGISRTVLSDIRSGKKTNCRKKTRDRVFELDISEGVRLHDAQLVDADPTWVLLNKLIDLGWTRSELGKRLGSKAKVPSLQIRKGQVTARTEQKVQRLYRRLTTPRWKDVNVWIAPCCGKDQEVSKRLKLRVCPRCQRTIEQPLMVNVSV